jgi:hypothetical protein
MPEPHAVSYKVAIFHDQDIVGTFTMPFLPYRGIVLAIAGGDTWYVDRVMVHVPLPGSATERAGRPWLVDVKATPISGIHDV